MDLKEIRNEIDVIDKEIIRLFEHRMKMSENVAVYKKENNMPIFQSERENEVIEKVKSISQDNFADSSQALFSTIMDISKSFQQQKIFENSNEYKDYLPFEVKDDSKIACQGTNGANSQEAARMIFGDRDINFYNAFEDVFKAVEDGEVDFGVLPIYNSTAGSVTQTYDLMRKYNFYIVKTVTIRIKHCLVAKSGTRLCDVKDVYSHPQALAQCSQFIQNNNLKQISYENTAISAKYVAESKENISAICSQQCAKLYGLDILSDDISDSTPNYTRFICISKKFMKSDDADTISVILTIPNEKGSLYRLLVKFFANGLNLERIESRPLAGGSFNVSFYLDFEGSLSDKKVPALLSGLKYELDEFKLLGNFSEHKI